MVQGMLSVNAHEKRRNQGCLIHKMNTESNTEGIILGGKENVYERPCSTNSTPKKEIGR